MVKEKNKKVEKTTVKKIIKKELSIEDLNKKINKICDYLGLRI